MGAGDLAASSSSHLCISDRACPLCSNELVGCLEDLREKREDLHRSLLRDEEEKVRGAAGRRAFRRAPRQICETMLLATRPPATSSSLAGAHPEGADFADGAPGAFESRRDILSLSRALTTQSPPPPSRVFSSLCSRRAS